MSVIGPMKLTPHRKNGANDNIGWSMVCQFSQSLLLFDTHKIIYKICECLNVIISRCDLCKIKFGRWIQHSNDLSHIQNIVPL